MEGTLPYDGSKRITLSKVPYLKYPQSIGGGLRILLTLGNRDRDSESMWASSMLSTRTVDTHNCFYSVVSRLLNKAVWAE